MPKTKKPKTFTKVLKDLAADCGRKRREAEKIALAEKKAAEAKAATKPARGRPKKIKEEAKAKAKELPTTFDTTQILLAAHANGNNGNNVAFAPPVKVSHA